MSRHASSLTTNRPRTGESQFTQLHALQVAAVKQPTMFNGSDNDRQISREKLDQFAAVLKDKAGVESDVKVRCCGLPDCCIDRFHPTGSWQRKLRRRLLPDEGAPAVEILAAAASNPVTHTSADVLQRCSD